MKQSNLFEERIVQIRDNPTLESIANLILRLVDNEPELLNGNRIGEVDRKLKLAVWLSQGLSQILDADQLEQFKEWFYDTKRCADPEVVRRARQYLVQHDHIRLSAEALRDGERQRARLGSSFGGRKRGK